MPLFIERGDIDALPPGAKKVTAEKVQEFYTDIIKHWKPESELWALVHGPNALGVVAACSGFHLNWFFRRQLKLRQHGYFSTFLPNTILPLLVSFAYHSLTQANLFTNTEPDSRNLQAKAVAGQLAFGLLQPLTFVPFSAFMFATRHFTARVPSPWHEPKKFLKYWGNAYTPIKHHLVANAIIQSIAVLFVFRMAEKQFRFVEQSLSVSHEVIENKKNA